MSRVRIVNIKAFAAKELPPASSLRTMILMEDDEIPVAEFLVKIQLWLRLADVDKVGLQKGGLQDSMGTHP